MDRPSLLFFILSRKQHSGDHQSVTLDFQFSKHFTIECVQFLTMSHWLDMILILEFIQSAHFMFQICSVLFSHFFFLIRFSSHMIKAPIHKVWLMLNVFFFFFCLYSKSHNTINYEIRSNGFTFGWILFPSVTLASTYVGVWKIYIFNCFYICSSLFFNSFSLLLRDCYHS